MEQIGSFDFIRLHSDAKGNPAHAAALETLSAAVRNDGYTDVIFLAHGFRNDEDEASDLYTKFLTGFAAHASRPALEPKLDGRKFLTVGIYWPSKKFTEGEDPNDGSVQSASVVDERAMAEAELDAFLQDVGVTRRKRVKAAFDRLAKDQEDPENQDKFVAAVLDAIPFRDRDGAEGFEQIRSKSGTELLASLEAPILLPTRRTDDDGGVTSVGDGASANGDGGVLAVGGFFKSVMGRVGQVLNMGTWYTMKERSGVVGQRLVADTVRRIARERPAVRVHLVGHSLGGRLMASAARALAAGPKTPVASLTLLEAAFSHYGFSANADGNKPGYFRDVIGGKVVKGPLISTHSYQDTVVGKAYAIASRLAGDSTKAVGDKDDRYGGIGRNGVQKTDETTAHLLQAPGGDYRFVLGTINDIDGSGGGIRNHGDVTNDKVTYAFAVAMAET